MISLRVALFLCVVVVVAIFAAAVTCQSKVGNGPAPIPSVSTR